MTAQIPEQLLLRGERRAMFSHPLEAGLRDSPITNRLRATSSANWRRYVGSWAIQADRLYLLGVDARWLSGERVTLDQLFPDPQWPLLATWFSGDLELPEGELVEYVHVGYGSIYEGRRILRVESGCLVGEREEKTPQLAVPAVIPRPATPSRRRPQSFWKKLWAGSHTETP